MIFKTEVIYSSFTFFQGIGMLFGFLVTTYLCTYIKIYIIIGYCGLSFLCGVGLYFRQRREKTYETGNTEIKIDKTAEKIIMKRND
jgi:hypothetical protein